MKIEELKQNLENARTLAREMETVETAAASSKEEEKELMQRFLANAKEQLKTISSIIPSFFEKERKISHKIEYNASEKKKYLRELGLEASTLKAVRKKIEKRGLEISKLREMYKKPGFFTKMSGKIFSGFSLNLVNKGMFKNINNHLRKANMPYLLSTYVSIALLCSAVLFFLAIFAALLLMQSLGAIAFLIALAIPIISFFTILYYPLSEAASSKGKIDDELPFAIMHMAAIAGSGVEPSKVFAILAASPEYPTVRKEMRKIVNLINFYGYDLTTALKNTAKTTSSERLAELLNGISTTISGGGELRNYLDKIAEDSLMDYKLRRKRFTTISETYADIYTGLLIAAPLIFMLILVLMNVLGGGIAGMTTSTVALIGIGALVVLNIGFLIFLQISQPTS